MKCECICHCYHPKEVCCGACADIKAYAEKSCNLQIDENRKVSRRLDELELAIESVSRTQGHFEDLIKHAECGIDKVFERMENIEKFMSLDKELKPYICPACDGFGKRTVEIIGAQQCEPCQGKGIVWK